MTLEGRAFVSARRRDGRLAAVRVGSERPLVADRLLRGRTPEEVLALMPGLFAICGRSQAVVAAAALDAAAGITADADVQRHRQRELAAETLAEHAFRLLLDWPPLVGEPADIALLNPVRSLLAGATASQAAWDAARRALLDLATDRLLGMDARAWLDHDAAQGWIDWAQAARTPTARTLAGLAAPARWPGRATKLLPGPGEPRFLTATAQAALSDPAFAATPTFAGAPAECGALARSIAHPAVAELARGDRVVARAFARLAELVGLLLEASPAAASQSLAPGPGIGAAAADMARGVLLHVVRLDGGRVVQYVIVAPTEWNFHPAGALFDTLEGRPAADAGTARHALGLAAATLDPCVAMEVDLQDA